jgi:hypothetical protein
VSENKTSIILTAVDQASKTIAGVGGSIGSLADRASLAKDALAGIAGSAVITGIGAMAKSLIDAADSMNDLTQRIGIGVKNLATWQLAANQSGTSIEAVAKGVKSLSGNLLDHSIALKAAGISATDANGAMIQIADLFAAMPDGIEKTTLATKLFGKAGMEMIPMLNLGSEGMQTAQEKAARYADELEKLAPKADEFNDQIAELALQSKAAGMNMLQYFMPGLIGITQWLNDAAAGGARAEQALNFLAQSDSPLVQGMVRFNRFINTPGSQGYNGPKDALGLPASTQSAAPDWGAWDAATEAYVKQADAKKRGSTLLKSFGSDKSAGSIKAEIDEIGNLLTSLSAKSAGFSADFQKNIGTLQIGLMSGRISAGEFGDAVQQLMKQQPAYAEEIKKVTKAQEDAWKIEAERIEGAFKTIDTLDAEILKLKEQGEEIGLTSDALTTLRLRRMDDTIAIKERQAAQASATNGEDAYVAALRIEIEQLQEIRTLTSGNALKEASAEAAKKTQEDWQRTWERLGDSLSDEIMRGGKSAGELLKDYFRTLVLKPIIQGGVQMGMQALGLGNFAGSAGAAGNLLNLGGMAGSAFSAIGAGGAGAGFLSGISETMLGSSFVGPSASLAGGATGAMASVGAAMPYVAAALAVGSLLSSKGGGPKSFAAGGDLTADFTNTRSGEIDTLAASIKQSYADVLGAYGIKPGSISAAFIGESDPQGTAADFTRFRVRVGDQERADTDEFGRGEWQKNAAGVAAKAILAALEATNINTLVDQYLDALDIGGMDGGRASSILETVRAIGALSQPLPNMMEQIRRNGLSAFGVWQAGADDMADLVSNLDGSLSSMQALSVANQARYAQELQLVQQIQTAMETTSGMFGDSIRNIQLSVLDDAGKYNFFDKEAARYRDMLASVTDPQLISDYAAKLNNSIMSGYGVLNPEQQQAKADEYIALIQQADELSRSRFDVAQTEIINSQQAFQDTVAAAVTNAVQQIAAAAAVPQQVQVGIRIDSPVPAETTYIEVATG